MKLLKTILKYSLIGLSLVILGIIWLFGYKDIPLAELKAKYADESSAFIRVGQIDVHYRDQGPRNDRPLVLVHGTGSSLHTFDAWTDELQKHHRVIRMDLPAYGLTGPFPNRDYSTHNYVDFIYEFLKHLNIKTCILGGNSLGGNIAWNFTLKHPDMVEKLVLIDASGYPTSAQSEPLAFTLAKIPAVNHIFTYITPRYIAERSVNNVYADKTKVTKELVDRYFELTLREGNRQAFVDKLNNENNSNSYNSIPSIQQSTLILWGAEDKLIPVENAFKFEKNLKNDTLVILKNVGHVPMEESPKESLIPLLSFLQKE
jgi:pimeloyl-ACP methyl ester carboxylesterase